MSDENTPVEETATETEAAAEDTTAVAVEEAPQAEPETQAETEAEPEIREAPVNVQDEHQNAPEGVVVAEAPAGVRQAKVYLCERGHRTLILWGEPPAACNARPTRSGPPCGRPIYHMTELPEQVQKALNPLKASKKKAGKK